MNLTFRHATDKDIPLIAQLADKIWHEYYPAIITVEQVDYMLHNRYSIEAIAGQMKSREIFFLAYDGVEPIAYASVELKTGYWFLHKFYVDVAKHRNGIGKHFWAYLISQIGDDHPIKLQVNRQNITAVNFYFEIGFTIESIGDFDIGNGYFMNDFVMVKKPTPNP